ncbi:MAG: baseplate J/gp47 family protein [Bacillota bacterium]|jgi:hypothetical protein|nr:baseplate J/gp47 family protein [Bacillota bacterium]HPZ54148.1 baseplate J/gp47 family protein [Bacillota bacterium]HQD18070.1 baseplate J/gp47 family protein [Bacillota bacterium]
MNSEPRVLVLDPDASVSSLIRDIRASLSDNVIIDARLSDALKNEPDLRLLIHYARDDGKRITIVTRDPAMSALADQLGIEVLSELPAGEHEREEIGQPDTSALQAGSADGLDKPKHASAHDGRSGVAQSTADRSRRMAGRLVSRSSRPSVLPRVSMRAVVALVVIVMAITVVTAYVRSLLVEVTVVPATARVSETLIIGVDSGLVEPETALGINIPSERLATEVQYSREILTTGELREGITPAVGEVLLINSGSAPVRVPARTKLWTADGIEFETVNDVQVDPKTTMMRAGIKIGETSGTALVAATAVEPGSSGNIPALSIISIEEPFSDLLQVTNENEFRGGRDRVIRVVSEDDVEQLRRMSEDRMLEDGARRLAELAGLDMYLLLPTLELEIRSLQIYPEVAKESERVSIQTAGVVGVDAVRLEDLSKAIGDKLSGLLGEGYALIADSLAIDSLSSSRLSSGQTVISVDVSALFKAEISPHVVAEFLAGEGFDEVRDRLIGSGRITDLAVHEEIEAFPRWPRLIRVVVSEPL